MPLTSALASVAGLLYTNFTAASEGVTWLTLIPTFIAMYSMHKSFKAVDNIPESDGSAVYKNAGYIEIHAVLAEKCNAIRVSRDNHLLALRDQFKVMKPEEL